MTDQSPVILTWGYREHTHAHLQDIVHKSGDGALIVDVRRDAEGGNPVWSAQALSQLLGAQYLHQPALGNRKDARNGEWVPPRAGAAKDALAALATLYGMGGGPVILLCAEFHNRDCHRRQVAEQLRRRIPGGAHVKHLV